MDKLLQKYEEEKRNYIKKLAAKSGVGKSLSDAEEESILKEYYYFILKNFENGVIDDKKFAYDVTGTVFCEASKNKIFSEIIDSAGKLELPDQHIKGDIKAKINTLIELIKRL